MKAIRNVKIRFTAALFVFLLVFSLFPLAASAAVDITDPTSVALYAVSGGEMLAAKELDAQVAPASTAKIMSGLLFCETFLEKDEDCKNNEKLQREITVTAEMLAGVSGRKLGLAVGDVLTLEALLYSAVGGGYNDATHVLACTVAGSVNAFTEKMNARAAELGASSTHFKNPTGLDAEGATTTARDVVKISLAAAESRAFLKMTSFYTYKVAFANGTSVSIENRNLLHFPRADSNKWYNNEAVGMSVGMTDDGGYCLVTLGRFGNADFLCVVLGASEEDEAYSVATQLLGWANDRYEVVTLRTAGENLGSLPVSLSDTYNKIDIVLGSDVTLTVPRGAALDEAYTYELHLDFEGLKAPIKKGEAVGRLDVMNNGRVVASAAAVTAMDVEANGFLATVDTMKTFFTSPLFLIIIAILIVASGAAFLLSQRGGRRYSRRRSSYRRRYY